MNDTFRSCADLSCDGGISTCLLRAVQSPKKLHDIYRKHVEFGLMCQNKRNELLTPLLNTLLDDHINWLGTKMCLGCFAVAFGISEKRLREKLLLVARGAELARKVGSGQRVAPKTEKFLGYLEDLTKNQAEKSPKGGRLFSCPRGKPNALRSESRIWKPFSIGTIRR